MIYNKFTDIQSSIKLISSINALVIKTFIVFNLVFANNTILSHFFFFFPINDLYFLIPAVIKEIFIIIAELAIPTGIPTKEARAEIETYPVSIEARISECSV